MKRLGIILSLFTLLSSCTEEADNLCGDIVGKWQLIEYLVDPGDGRTDFTPISSDKTITFMDDGTFEANAQLCVVNSNSGQTYTGTYTSTIINPGDCQNGKVDLYYKIEDQHLILYYQCIEACAEKYKKVEV